MLITSSPLRGRRGLSTVTLTVLPSAWSAVAMSSRFWVAVVMWLSRVWLLYRMSDQRSSKFLEHLVHLGGVDPSIHPASAVWCHLTEGVLKRRDQSIVAGPLTEATCLLNVINSETVHGLFVVDVEAGVPGLIVGPSVEGVLLGHGPGSRGHVVLFVWYTAIVGHGGSDIRRAVPVRHPSQCPQTHPHRLAPSGSVRHQGSLARSSCRP